MGRYFGTEPAQFLRGSYLEWAVNLAAYDVTSRAEAEVNKRAAMKSRR